MKKFITIVAILACAGSLYGAAHELDQNHRTQIWSWKGKTGGEIFGTTPPKEASGTKLVFDFKGYPATAIRRDGEHKGEENTLIWKYLGLAQIDLDGQYDKKRNYSRATVYQSTLDRPSSTPTLWDFIPTKDYRHSDDNTSWSFRRHAIKNNND